MLRALRPQTCVRHIRVQEHTGGQSGKSALFDARGWRKKTVAVRPQCNHAQLHDRTDPRLMRLLSQSDRASVFYQVGICIRVTPMRLNDGHASRSVAN